MGALELLIIAVVVFGIPMLTLWRVAVARGHGANYALWGLLSWAGLVIGLLVLIATPVKATPDATK